VQHINFTHDINPGNGPAISSLPSNNAFGARVFWTAVIPDEDVQVNPGTGAAELHVRDFSLLDYYSPQGTGDVASLGTTWQSGYFNATVSIDVVWSGPVTRRVNVTDAANGFAGTFNENQATVRWSVHSESGFDFVSNPGDFSTSVPEVAGVNGVTAPLNFFAQVGHEQNGIFFPSGNGQDQAISLNAISPLGATISGWSGDGGTAQPALNGNSGKGGAENWLPAETKAHSTVVLDRVFAEMAKPQGNSGHGSSSDFDWDPDTLAALAL
jgi:hypothetical protein